MVPTMVIDAKFDEWLPAHSKRIAPFGSQTRRDSPDYTRLYEKPHLLLRQNSMNRMLAQKRVSAQQQWWQHDA